MKTNNLKTGRREFLKESTKIVAGISALSMGLSSNEAAAAAGKKRVALVGTGIRGTRTWGKNLLEQLSGEVEMVGLCDINPKRVEYAKKYIGINAPTFAAEDFDRMIKETKPDAVIITTPDCFHAKYAVRAMELGCDAICEKPLATEAEQCQKLMDTEVKTGKRIITTFNVRYMTEAEEIKKVIMSGELGRIISAEFTEYLDIDHGASYFRRWHGKAQFSGTLLLSKASHHFDQMNWTLDADPETVHAFGKVAFYGKNNSFRARNCRTCPFTNKCDFYWDITKDKAMMDLYVKNEDADGYLRDGCVWDNDIDTYDSMTAEVKYNNGVLLNYSMNAFLPYEGQSIAFNGEKGRLDVRLFHRQPWEVASTQQFRLTRNFKETRTWSVEPGVGSHGGADAKLKNMLFSANQPDPLGKMAGSRAGVMASIVGIAARKSIETGETVNIDELVTFPLTWGW
ncbi:MAG: Gfo/Idh/MocA family protein [Methanosarcinaceae archaeon]